MDSIYAYCMYTVQYEKEKLTPKLSADLNNCEFYICILHGLVKVG